MLVYHHLSACFPYICMLYIWWWGVKGDSTVQKKPNRESKCEWVQNRYCTERLRQRKRNGYRMDTEWTSNGYRRDTEQIQECKMEHVQNGYRKDIERIQNGNRSQKGKKRSLECKL